MKPGREAEAAAIFEKWELDFAIIGRVTQTGKLVLKMAGNEVAALPVEPLVSQAPQYERPTAATELQGLIDPSNYPLPGGWCYGGAS